MTDSILFAANSLIRSGAMAEAKRLLAGNLRDRACATRLRELLVGEGDYDGATEVARSLAVGSDAEAHVSRSFLAMLQGDLKAALGECQQALRIDQRVASIHNHAGRALHNAGQPEQSVQALQRAIELQADYPEAWHNLGHVQRAVGQLSDACHAYQKALELAPGYRSAALNLGKTLFNQERIAEALETFETWLEKSPGDVEALTDGGLALHLLGRLDESRRWYERALASDDSFPLTHVYLAILLNELQDADAATSALKKCLAIDPHNIEAWVELTGTHELCNRLDEAEAALGQGLALAPDHPALLLESAKLSRRRGDFDAALLRLHSINPADLPMRLRKPYFFELAGTLDRLEKPVEAHDAYEHGNQLAAGDVRRQGLDGQRYLDSLTGLQGWVRNGGPGLAPQDDDPGGDTGSDLCFLHGFTRSGTTLLDMMLDVHPELVSLEEASTFEAVIRELDQLPDGYPQAIASLDGETVEHLRSVYREAVSPWLGDGSPTMVIDKMPMRFIHSGLINRIFPEARILFALRHPCDVVLSNFMQQYPSTTDFLVNFDTLHGGAEVYDRTFSLWAELEPLLTMPVQYLRYEDLVSDPASELKNVCEFLGIDMRDDMLDTAARMGGRDRVITPSYQQVSEPVYQRAAERWRRYGQFLRPELPLLRAHAERFSYTL